MLDISLEEIWTPEGALIPKTIESAESGFDDDWFSEKIDPIGAPGNYGCGRSTSSEYAKAVHSWDTNDIFNWLTTESAKYGIDCTQLRGENFSHLTGKELAKMSAEEFERRAPEWGQFLFCSIVRIQLESNRKQTPHNTGACYSESVYKEDESTFVDLDDRYYGEKNAEIKASEAAPVPEPPTLKTPEPETSTQVIVKKRGRPKNPNKQGKKKSQSSRRLWEFLRDLLSDPKTCPSMIKWENIDEGMFRFVQSDTVAKIWGSRKGNKEMSYEKLSRAMRYYYKSGVLQPVYGRRLVYKFGPKATGWRVADPNFEMKRAHDRASSLPI